MDFALILFIGLICSGGIVLWSHLKKSSQDTEHSKEKKPGVVSIVVDYSRAFFPVILIVFLVRSFIVEPFRIPSGSMLPTLFIGDFILVDKFRYGIRLPIINFTLIPTSLPKRGEVMVFRYPHDNSTNFIKRVIGVPGDEIIYSDKQLYINGDVVALEKSDSYEINDSNDERLVVQLSETIGDSKHSILTDRSRRSRAMRISVPEDNYFVMGDNRDHSNDSRFWGFVPEENIVGRAFLVWFSWNSKDGGVNWGRIGHGIL